MVGRVVGTRKRRARRRDKEEEGPIGFLAGGPKFEVTPLIIPCHVYFMPAGIIQ